MPRPAPPIEGAEEETREALADLMGRRVSGISKNWLSQNDGQGHRTRRDSFRPRNSCCNCTNCDCWNGWRQRAGNGSSTMRHRSTRRDKRPSSGPGEVGSLQKALTAYEWQRSALIVVRERGSGTVKVVTGGGKTLLALSIAERIQNHGRQAICDLLVVVPTIVLMHQWYDAMLEHGNLPKEAIGRLGDGYLKRLTRTVGS